MGHVSTDSQWYLAELVMEITVEEAARNIVHKNLVLLQAESPEHAYDKATAFGQKAETSYVNPEDRIVRIKFRGISKLDVLYEDLDDGAELTFEEHIGLSPEELQRLIPPRDQLSVFVAPRPVAKRDPDYRSKAVMQMAIDRVTSEESGNR